MHHHHQHHYYLLFCFFFSLLNVIGSASFIRFVFFLCLIFYLDVTNHCVYCFWKITRACASARESPRQNVCLATVESIQLWIYKITAAHLLTDPVHRIDKPLTIPFNYASVLIGNANMHQMCQWPQRPYRYLNA